MAGKTKAEQEKAKEQEEAAQAEVERQAEADRKAAEQADAEAQRHDQPDEDVSVRGMTKDNAILLLAAAADLEMDSSVVQTTTKGVFRVPRSVAEKADLLGEKQQTTIPGRSARADNSEDES